MHRLSTSRFRLNICVHVSISEIYSWDSDIWTVWMRLTNQTSTKLWQAPDSFTQNLIGIRCASKPRASPDNIEICASLLQ